MTKINMDEWQAEIDKFQTEHSKNKQTKYELTEEQIKYIEYCRSKTPPVSWRNIVMLFKRHGWRCSHTRLRIKWSNLPGNKKS